MARKLLSALGAALVIAAVALPIVHTHDHAPVASVDCVICVAKLASGDLAPAASFSLPATPDAQYAIAHAPSGEPKRLAALPKHARGPPSKA